MLGTPRTSTVPHDNRRLDKICVRDNESSMVICISLNRTEQAVLSGAVQGATDTERCAVGAHAPPLPGQGMVSADHAGPRGGAFGRRCGGTHGRPHAAAPTSSRRTEPQAGHPSTHPRRARRHRGSGPPPSTSWRTSLVLTSKSSACRDNTPGSSSSRYMSSTRESRVPLAMSLPLTNLT